MRTTVKKRGNSAGGADSSGREANRARIVIEPVRQKTYDLRELLKGITPENRHEAVDFGPGADKEVW